MKLKDFVTNVQQSADTVNQGIDAADVSRVVATFFLELADLSPLEMADVLAQGLKRAEAKRFP